MAHILLAEDDQYLSDGLSRTLRHSGHIVECIRNGVDAENAVKTNNFDLVILDIGLPLRDGLTVLRNWRNSGKSLPVLMLTARDTPEDRICGLDFGANDYLCKPFNIGELEARIRALLRKDKWSNKVCVQVGELTFDTVANRFSVKQQPVDLSPREYLVLELLLQRRGRVVFKGNLLEHLSSLERDISANALDIIIFRLRKKLENSGCVIQTVKGMGYIVE